MQIIKCKYCGKSNIEFGETSVTINFNKTIRCCKSCNNTNTETHNEFFCSTKCFRNYMYEQLSKNIDG